MQNPQTTSAPELRVRQDACQQESQRASEAIRQASQQASQSVQQASQQASQASREATQSANQAIQRAQQTASQSIAEALRSASSISSSANSVVSSIRASADSEIFRANLAMQTAQLSASVAQSEASRAVLLAQQLGPTAASQLSQTSPIALSPPATTTITGPHLALAIVGSIIASSLITAIAYFVFLRHKRLSRAARSKSLGDGSNDSVDDLKFPGVTTKVESSKSGRDDSPQSPHVTFSIFPRSSKDKTSKGQKASVVKTSLPKTSAETPKSPSSRSWLRRHGNVSPFGPLQLPTTGSKGPLGGQLKSPLRGPPARFVLDVSANKEDVLTPAPSTSIPDPSTSELYRESKASVWTDTITDDGSARGSAMTSAPLAPPPRKPVRNTAEWLMDHATFQAFGPGVDSRDSKQSLESRGSVKPGFAGGLPSNPKGPSQASRQRSKLNQQGNGMQDSNGSLDPRDRSRLGRGGDTAQPNTPGVGKAV